MNLDAYISTGILESYALGELTDLERLEVERHLAEHPELRRELAAIEETLELLMTRAGSAPSLAVKERLLQEVKSPVRSLPHAVGQTPSRGILVWQYATAASLALALGAAWMAYTFWGNWKQSEYSLNEMRAFNAQVAQDYNQVNHRLDLMENEMKVMNNPSFMRVMMKGTDHAPDAMASVYWNPKSEEVFLSVLNLKRLTSDQQYQLWAIVDGKPVDVGMFDSPQEGNAINGLMKMKQTAGASAFAVTIEPRGGKGSPTMETMQVVGNT